MKLATFGELILSCQTAFKNRWPTLCHVHVPLFLILILDQPFSTFNQNTWHSVSATSCLMSKTGSFGHVLQRIMWGIFRGSLFLRLWRTKIHDIQSLPAFKVQIHTVFLPRGSCLMSKAGILSHMTYSIQSKKVPVLLV